MEHEDFDETYEGFASDHQSVQASDKLRDFFDKNRDNVFFSRQLEVIHEHEYFHWITSRSIRQLEGEDLIRCERRQLRTGTSIKLIWHKSYRFQKRSAKALLSLVEDYSDPNIGAFLGLHCEMMVLEGFARNQFVMCARNARRYDGKIWTESNHDLDFIFERDGIAYGLEVKNTLGYMDQKEFLLKTRLCKQLGIKPVFICRMLPKSWIHELNKAGGFALIFKYQLYPWTHHQLAKKVAQELKLPVDAPRALAEGTMGRFLKWHLKHV